MSDPIDRQAFLNLCEMSIDNTYELAALGELLEQKGLITKQEILALAKDLKQQTPPAETGTASTNEIPSLPPFTDRDNAAIEQIMDVILRHGLTTDQSKRILERTITLLEWGEKTAPRRRIRLRSKLGIWVHPRQKTFLGSPALSLRAIPGAKAFIGSHGPNMFI